MSKFLNRKSSLRLLSCVMAFCMCITAFANTIGFYATAEETPSVTVWDGTDNYENLDALLVDLGAVDSEGYYHITTANQLHAAIRFGGADYKYKLDNDLYLNENWENYASWNNDSKDINDWNLSGVTCGFSGTIDGDGHTIYGYFNRASDDKTTTTPGQFVGLIPTVNGVKGATQNVTLKNLHMAYATQQGNTASGFFIGATRYEGSGSVTIEGCSVRNGLMHLIWGGNNAGAFVGRANNATPVTISNCAASDIKFDIRSSDGGLGYNTLGSFVGATASNVSSNYTFNGDQAKSAKIYDSYAVNCINGKTNTLVYVCGLYQEGKDANNNPKYSHAVTVSNVYTDATEVPTNVAGTAKLFVTEDGKTAVEPTDEAYPIKAITADGIKGAAAKTAMPNLDWKVWSTVDGGYPVYIPLEIWDGTDDYASLDALLADLGAADSDGYYHITTANQLHAAIRLGGGDNKYKLDNDLYLNEDWKNSSSWTFDAPTANNWGLCGTGYSFSGTIDGDDHTIYGYYNRGKSTAYVGLIPVVNWNSGDTQNVTIKNLHFENAFQQGNTASGLFVGAASWQGSGSVTIEGCTVRKAEMHMIWGDAHYVGTFVGTASNNSPVTIRNCAAIDVIFDARAYGTVMGYSTLGSFTGATYCNTNDTYTFNGDQARAIKIYDSYAVNCINKATNTPIYICGVLREGYTKKYSYCVTASNVYTDATEIPTTADGSVKLLVTEDGKTEVAPTSAEYPIRTVSADDIKGDAAKYVMPKLNWNAWYTVNNDYPAYNSLVVWDGTDNYATLDDVLAELTVDTDNYYHITTANQFHAVIRLGGGDNKYKLDNDLYLNEDWKNSASWTFDAPAANNWGLCGTGYSFSGTIDGAGHTIYGYYNRGKSTAYVGLIPVVNWNEGDTQNVTIKNLHFENAFQQGNTASGLFIGATNWKGSGSVTIEGCTVRKAEMHMIWSDTHYVGTFVGTASNNSPVTIRNCAAIDVIFDARAYGTVMGYSTLGSFAGATFCNTSDTYTFNPSQAQAVKIYDSYAVNCINKKTNTPVYICGVLREGGKLYSYCVTASNVYTDATEIPTTADGSVKLLVTEDGKTEVAPTSAAYPIKNIANDKFTGLYESGAWYRGVNEDSLPILKCKTAGFAYLDITGEGIDDIYSAVDYVYLKKNFFETKGYEYILADVNGDNNVDILDIVKIKNILLGK